MTALAGFGPLTRLALRRDRIMMAAWVYLLTAFAYVSVDATQRLYPTAASRLAFAAGAGANTVTTALYGPAADLNTLGGLAMWKMTAIGAVCAAVMSISIVNRHTRADEDAGRLDLAGAGAVGRSAPLTAALLAALAANLLLALLVTAGLLVAGLPGADSLVFGFGLAATGCVFAAVAGLAGQIAGSARGATAISAGLLGAAYLLRAAGDAASAGSWTSGLSWASPIGWMEKVRPFGPAHWQLLGLSALCAIVVAGAGYLLAARRDLGSGILPARPGRPRAGAGLRGPFGLAWRLQRGPLLAWAAGFAVYGLILGALANGVRGLVGSSSAAKAMFLELGGQAGLVDAFLAAVMGVMGVLAAVYAVQAVLRLRGEEAGQLAEPVLASRVGRIRWALSHLLFAVAGPVVLLGLAGLAAGLAHGARSGGEAEAVGRLLGAAVAQAPAAWVVAGIAAALFGVAPRLAPAAWGALLVFLFLSLMGALLGLSQWVMDLSPFTHVPKLPGGAFTATPLAWLTVVALAFAVAGLASLRRRDVG